MSEADSTSISPQKRAAKPGMPRAPLTYPSAGSEADRQRFWRKVLIVDDVGSCWEWQAATGVPGYGILWWDRKYHATHRISYVLAFGGILPGLCVLHRCDNRKCVRPSHLFLGTQQENDADRVQKGRQARGKKNANAKLTESQIPGIRARWKDGETIAAIARSLGIGESAIRSIVFGETWKHVA